jgi:mannose-6-phosphate isomerase-like protein (cupin superfamily)
LSLNSIYNSIKEELESKTLTISNLNLNKPWGGFVVIDEHQTRDFAIAYFENMYVSSRKISDKLSPKILIVAPHKRLSWQFHHRRAEIWRVIKGNVGVITSDNDIEGPLKKLVEGEFITLKQGERHRLVGLDDWAVIAEIWQHTDPNNPSDEEDIVRVQDDFGRI